MTSAARMDLSEFLPMLAKYQQLVRADLVRILLSRDFVARLRVYLIQQMDNALELGKDMQEGDVRVIRGQVWKGWAQRTVTKYGESTVDGTRFYMRKYRRGLAFTGPRARGFYVNQKRTFRGTLKGKERREWERTRVRDREFELIWRTRASGQRYSANSELMRDRGTMQQAWANIQVSISGNVIEFTPGSGAAHFEFQNDMRPIFVIDPNTDTSVIVGYAEDVLKQRLAEVA